MKRITIVSLLVVLPLIAFAGGTRQSGSGSSAAGTSNLNATGWPIVKEKITLSLFGYRSSIQSDWEKMPFWTIMEEKSNIHFTFDLATDALQERKNLLLASGDYPDIFYGAIITADEELMYGGQGVFQKLDGYIAQYGPEITTWFNENPGYKDIAKAPDGNIYTLPYGEMAPRNTVYTKLWVNDVWLENLGLQMPKTLDEYYAMLVAFRDQDPNRNGKKDEIPFSSQNTLFGMTRGAFLAALGVMYRGASVDVDSLGKVFYIFTSDAYRDYLTFMNKLYTEKLIDGEMFTQTSQQLVAKGNQSLIGSFAHIAPFLVDTQDNAELYTAIPPMTSARNNRQQWPNTSPLNFGQFAMTDRNKYPEATIRWIDYFFSYEGAAFMMQGPEGLGWEYTDRESGHWIRKPAPAGFASVEEWRGTITPNCGTPTPGIVPASFLLNVTSLATTYLEPQIARTYLPYMKDSFPMVKFTATEQEELGVLSTDINKYVEEMEARFITGDANLNTWNNYVRDLTNMNVARLVELYQAAYNRMKGN
jgi:putative aldouronate transport system substrate-binding protein